MGPEFHVVPVSERELVATERRLGFVLPAEYREFLGSGRGGPPLPGSYGDDAQEVDVEEFYRPAVAAVYTDRENLRLGFLSIARCTTGDEFAIHVREGSIHYREHEHRVDDLLGSYRPVAPTLAAFLRGFHAPSKP